MKIREALDKILSFHAPIHGPRTADTVKIGDAEQECTGIAVTCFCSVDVIRQAVEKKANLIICHEPLFFGDTEQEGMDEADPVYAAKKKLLEENGIVVWRDHDHMHGPGGPGCTVHEEIDYIYYGIMKELGWEKYVRGETTKPVWYEIPPTTVKALAKQFLDAFGLTGLRVVGDPEASVSTVYVCEHVNGRPDDNKKIALAAKADVMVPLEIVDWTLSEYVRDSAQLGRGKAILEMGHFNTEELGMKYMVRWLPDVVGTELPVHFIPSGDSFSYITR